MTDEGQRVTSKFLMQRFDISDRTVDRWEADPKLNFPKALRINGRRYWLLADIVEWERSREAETRLETAA